MSKLTAEEIKHLASLCRIDCTEEERASLLHDLKKILDYVEQLSSVDTQNVEPCKNVLEEHQSSRKDIVGPVLEKELFLSNASESQDDSIRVPSVIPS